MHCEMYLDHNADYIVGSSVMRHAKTNYVRTHVHFVSIMIHISRAKLLKLHDCITHLKDQIKLEPAHA